MLTIAARARRSKEDSDVLKEQIKSGMNKLGDKKKQLEQSQSAKVQEAKERLLSQAEEQHKKFTAMSSNTMNQHKENVQNLVSNKMQDLYNVTEKWKEGCERAVKLIYDKQAKQFERRCQESQEKENEKAVKFQKNQERTLKTTMMIISIFVLLRCACTVAILLGRL
jgi:hypothetical protein